VAPLKKFVGKAGQRPPARLNTVSPVQLALVALLSLFIGVVLAVSVVPPEVVGMIQKKESFMGRVQRG